MITINICTKKGASNPIKLDKDASTLRVGTKKKRIYKYYTGTSKARILEFYSFDDLKDDDERVAVWISLPPYFEELNSTVIMAKSKDKDFSKSFGLHGLFLVKDIVLKGGLHCMHIGPNGCPPPLMTGDFEGFKFNFNRFYPFVMTDYTVGWFSTDIDSADDKLWQANIRAKKRKEGVAIIEPIVYNATLGIYMTRQAELRDVSQFLV